MIHCEQCGESRGSFIKTARGWLCLRHLPKMGKLADRRQGGRSRSPRSIPGTTVQP